MNNTDYNSATAIKIQKAAINALMAKLVSNTFTPADLLAIYTALGDEYLDYVGKLYTSVPNVEITGDGSDAEAVAVLTNGILSAVNVIVPGQDYTNAEIVFSGGGGAGAAAHALISGSADSITSIEVDYESLISKLYGRQVELDAEFAAL
jgi:hypothetical protein